MKIVIIGAGPGGLTAGMLLSKDFDIEIFEKEALPGGRNAPIKSGGYTFDAGPTFLMMKYVLDEIFEASGRRTSDYLDIKRLDPMYQLRFGNDAVNIYNDHKKTAKELEKISPEDSKAFLRFLRDEKKRYDLLIPILKKDYSKWSSLLDFRILRALPKLGLFSSVFDVIRSYFKNKKTRLCFTFQTKYLGMSPWDCPAAFTIIPYVEHIFGIYHVQGGLCRISEAMAKAVKEDGGKINYNAPVDKVIVENGKAVGVRLKSGREIRADAVIINADFAHAMSNLFETGTIKKYTPEKLMKKKYSCSTFMLYLGLKKKYNLKHHTIVFADDYKRNIHDIFAGKISREFSMYVQNASATDPNVAPKGKSTLYVLVPVSNKKANINWKEEKKRVRDRAISVLKERLGMKDIEEQIEKEIVYTPDTWEEDYNVFMGATFNLAHTFSQMTVFRPHNRFEVLENCYLVGGGTHPGSGLPTIYESGRITAKLLKEDLKTI